MHQAKPTSKYLSIASWLYLFGILGLGSLAYSDMVLDRTLLPRFGISLFFLFPISGILLFRSKNIRWPSLSLPFYMLLLFFIWNLQSLLWVATFSEALLECQRVFLSLAVFWLTLVFMENDRRFSLRLKKVAIALGVLYLATAFYQLGQIEGLDKLALYQVKGLSGHRNLLGAFLLLMMGFGAMLWKSEKGLWKWGSGTFIFGSLLLIMLLQARSTWLGLLTSGFIFLVLVGLKAKKIPRLDWRILLSFSSLFLLVLLWYHWQGGLAQLWERINIAGYLHSETAIERLRLWDKTLCTFEKSPWWGVGAGNWQTHFGSCGLHGLYSIELNNVTYQRPHNDFLWLLSENGLLGFMLYMGFIGSIIGKSLSRLIKTEEGNLWGPMLRLSLLGGILVISCFSFPKERVELLLWMYTLLAWIAVDGQSQKKEKKNTSAISRILLAAFIFGAAFSCFTLWKRAIGEYEMNQTYFLKAAQKWPEVLQSCEWGESPYYQLDPNAIPINWYRGTANFSMGEYQKARQNFEEALQIAPYNQHCWNDLGSCLEKTGDRKAAMNAYLKALDISPLFDDPRLNLGILAYKRKDYAQALHWLNSMQDSSRAKIYLDIVKSAQAEKK